MRVGSSVRVGSSGFVCASGFAVRVGSRCEWVRRGLSVRVGLSGFVGASGFAVRRSLYSLCLSLRAWSGNGETISMIGDWVRRGWIDRGLVAGNRSSSRLSFFLSLVLSSIVFFFVLSLSRVFCFFSPSLCVLQDTEMN